MTVLAPTVGELFVIRTIKHLATNPDNSWANSYEFQAATAVPAADVFTLAQKVVQFEQELHMPTVHFERVIVSTWEEDSVPYDPNSFVSIAQTAVGERTALDEPVDLQTCLSILRQVPSGRLGHIFYRGVLEEGNVIAPAGKSILEDAASWNTIIDGALISSGLADYFGNGAIGEWQGVMINKAGSNVRNIINLAAGGVAKVKNDHKWFNRTSP